MAKIKELYDRATGHAIYPKTISGAVICSDGMDLETRLMEDKRQTAAQLSNVLASEPLTPENFPEVNTYTREELKMDLFIDMWNQAWGKYGKYDPANAPDTKHPFMGNELWFTYEEAVEIFVTSMTVPFLTDNNYSARQITSTKEFRTVLPFCGGPIINLRQFGNNGNYINIIRFSPYYSSEDTIYVSDLTQAFYNNAIKRVLTGLDVSRLNTNAFYAMAGSNLEYLLLKKLKCDLNISSCSRLELYCFEYMIRFAANTSAITITVHPDVYAKLTDESNAEWHALLVLAAEKNINFATV